MVFTNLEHSKKHMDDIISNNNEQQKVLSLISFLFKSTKHSNHTLVSLPS